jgi:toxin YoeB
MQNLEFDANAFEDLEWWVEHDRRMALRLFKLIEETRRTPYEGAGQPEQLKHDLAGCWSRRINQEHRLVYQVIEEEDRIRILACRYHY